MAKWKQYLMLLASVLVCALLFGCTGQQANEVPANQAEVQSEQAAFPVTLTDAFGEEITIPSEPKRIVTLIPSNTEIAYALGLGEKIVGVSDYDTYPEEVKQKESIGGLNFNVEKVISLKPDLVLAHASGMQSKYDGIRQLKEAGIPVAVVNEAKSFDDVYRAIEFVGKATGTSDKAHEVNQGIQAKLAEIHEKAKQIKPEEQVKVWVEVSPAPEIFTVGKGTFMDEMLQAISAINVAGSLEGWPMVTEENAVAYKPDVILTTYGGANQVMDRPAWKEVPAVKNNRVYDVNPDLVTHPSPRLVEGVEELAKAVYPDIFR